MGTGVGRGALLRTTHINDNNATGEPLSKKIYDVTARDDVTG